MLVNQHCVLYVEDSKSGDIPPIRQSKRSLHSGTTKCGCRICLSASICSDDPFLHRGHPVPNRYTPATSGYPHRPLRAELTRSTLLNEAEVIGPAGECESCAILHTALVRALCSLQRDPSKGVSNSAHHNSPAGMTKDGYALRRRCTLPGGQYEDCSDADAPSIVDDILARVMLILCQALMSRMKPWVTRVHAGERQANAGDGPSWRNVVLERGSGKTSQKRGSPGSWIGRCQQSSSSGAKWFEKSNYLLS